MKKFQPSSQSPEGNGAQDEDSNDSLVFKSGSSWGHTSSAGWERCLLQNRYVHGSLQFNHTPIKIKKFPFANDWTKDVTEKSSAFPRPWKLKKQGGEKKLHFSH